jgi:hypothetical protein
MPSGFKVITQKKENGNEIILERNYMTSYSIISTALLRIQIREVNFLFFHEIYKVTILLLTKFANDQYLNSFFSITALLIHVQYVRM